MRYVPGVQRPLTHRGTLTVAPGSTRSHGTVTTWLTSCSGVTVAPDDAIAVTVVTGVTPKVKNSGCVVDIFTLHNATGPVFVNSSVTRRTSPHSIDSGKSQKYTCRIKFTVSIHVCHVVELPIAEVSAVELVEVQL